MVVQAGPLAAGDDGQDSVVVRVYDYAALPAFERENGMAVAQNIFRSAGIVVRWTDCSPAIKSGNDAPGCEGPLAATGVILNIVRRPLPECAHESLGCAVQDAKSGRGMTAYVFAQRLEETVQMGGTARFRLLGFAMAHELGHLLLGADAHSQNGIMQPNLSPRRMAEASGGVTFSLEQAHRMRSWIQTAKPQN